MGNFVDTREGEKLERKQEYKAELWNGVGAGGALRDRNGEKDGIKWTIIETLSIFALLHK